MDRAKLKFGFSPCPNDTFTFHAWVTGLLDGARVASYIDDVESLNERAEKREAELTKVSVAAFGRLRRDYALIRAGASVSCGMGPVVVTKTMEKIAGRVAVPGERTTAALLLRLIGRFETVSMRYSEIEEALLAGNADCGVLIHEGRFTYERKGLRLLADLGSVWEERMRCPLPLGAIAIRRDLAPKWALAVTRMVRASLDYAIRDPAASREFVKQHAREMAPDFITRHIQLYVNQYTREIDERAVYALLTFGESQGVFFSTADALPLFA